MKNAYLSGAWGWNRVYYGLKFCIFVEVGDLLLSGRSKCYLHLQGTLRSIPKEVKATFELLSVENKSEIIA